MEKNQTDCLFLHVPRIIKIHKDGYETFVNFISMGIFSMCNELYENGIMPKIIHLGVEKFLNENFDIGKYIIENNIKSVGISLHWHYQAYDSLVVARHIKEVSPETFVFVGGYTSSAFADEIIRDYKYIDAVIKGEGEKPVVELNKLILEGKKDFSSVPNLLWRKDGQIVKNEEVWFASEEDMNRYNFDGLKFIEHPETYMRIDIQVNKHGDNSFNLKPFKLVTMCLGRGCPGNCTWCGGGLEATKKISGRNTVVVRNPEVVAEEIINFKNKYGTDVFYVCFDPFPDNQNYLVKLFDILGERVSEKICIRFENFGLPTKEFLDSFKRNLSEDSIIIISPEFGDDDLRREHKSFPYTNEELLQKLEYIKEKNINCILYFTQYPSEPDIQKRRTMLFIKQINMKFPKFRCIFQAIEDYEPYSPWSANPEKYGLKQKLHTFGDYVKNSKGTFRDFI